MGWMDGAFGKKFSGPQNGPTAPLGRLEEKIFGLPQTLVLCRRTVVSDLGRLGPRNFLGTRKAGRNIGLVLGLLFEVIGSQWHPDLQQNPTQCNVSRVAALLCRAKSYPSSWWRPVSQSPMHLGPQKQFQNPGESIASSNHIDEWRTFNLMYKEQYLCQKHPHFRLSASAGVVPHPHGANKAAKRRNGTRGQAFLQATVLTSRQRVQ